MNGFQFPRAPDGFVWVYTRYARIGITQEMHDANLYGLEGFVILERKGLFIL